MNMTNSNQRSGSRLHRSIVTALVVLFCMAASPALAQHVVKGTVTDASGTALPGVTIQVRGGQKNATITDANGNYTISVPRNAQLVFSYIGMQQQTVNVGNKHSLDVSLNDDSSTLNDVVVVGYGQVRKQSLTGSVATLKGDELVKAPSTNVSSMLGGRIAGLTSVQTTGEPGADFASLRVRGSQYAPLVIIDGIQRSMNDIDPNDIESVSVLKDGAASAVYGLNAVGGVIIITTKKGQSGKTKVSYEGQYGISVNANFPTYMNGPEFADYYNMADLMDKLTGTTITDPSQYKPVFTRKMVEMMLNGDPTDGWDNVDYIGKVFGTGHNTKHNVKVEGGNDRTRFFVSAGYMGQSGNIDHFTYKRYNIRTNIDTKLGKGWKFTIGAVGTVTRNNKPSFDSGGSDDGSESSGEVGYLSIGHQAIMMHPFLPEKYNGLYTGTIPNNGSVSYSPLAAINESGYRRTHAFEINSNATLQYDAP